MSRPRPVSREPAEPLLAYVRDVDTPVALADVVAALELVTALAGARGDEELARAARHTHTLAVSLRAQFVSDLIGASRPSDSTIASDRAPRSRREDRETPSIGGATRMPAAR